MRADRFDDLTAALARATSRRNALRLLGVGMLAAVVDRGTHPREGTALPPEARQELLGRLIQAQPQPNVIHGTCIQFRDYALNTGVTDSERQTHKGYGYTEPDISHDTASWKGAQRRGWKCPCVAEKVYATQAECERRDPDNPCRPGLGGCLEKCGGGGVCIKTDPVKLSYTASPTILKLQWVPPVSEKQLSAQCKSHLSDINRHVDQHEQHHVDDFRTVVKEFNDSRPAKSYEACGADVDDATAKINQQISEDQTKDAAELQTRITAKVAEYHGTAEGSRLVNLMCDLCPY